MSASLNKNSQAPDPPARSLTERFQEVRQLSQTICDPLQIEDHSIQTMPDVSPPKWHLAHSTWFFETFLLKPYLENYQEFHPKYNFLFNSYYKGIGSHYPRAKRGLLSRPSISDILNYREHVDEKMFKLLQTSTTEEVGKRIQLGIHHEQQHQELLLTDIKHIFCTNPLHPVYRKSKSGPPQAIPSLEYLSFPEGFSTLGYNGSDFSFDNEKPHHRLWLNEFHLSHRLITNGEYLDFINDGAYQKPLLWLSDAWDWIQRQQPKSPLYWEINDGNWFEISLSGKNPLDLKIPVMHLNYYEADAFARWSGARLPTEAEWERAAMDLPSDGNFYHPEVLHPQPAATWGNPALKQMFGDLWEWTASPYTPYPGFKPVAGAVGEYNGKFMINQMVLRGGSCFTPEGHIRKTYRNFFPPGAQWQATGLRLAKDGRP